MKRFTILGTGCANCKRTMALLEDLAQELGIEVELVKEEDLAAIMGYGVMATPGVVLDGKVIHAGGVPSRQEAKQWLQS